MLNVSGKIGIRIARFIKNFLHLFITQRITYSASALTYTTLLSLVPLMTVTLSILSLLPVFDHISSQLQQFIFSNFVPTSQDMIQNYLQQFAEQAQKLPFVGFLFLVVTVIMLLLTVGHTINFVWGIEDKRKGWQLVRYWIALILAPFIMGLSIAATSYVVSLPLVVGAANALGAHLLVVRIVPIILLILGFAMLYYVVPNRKIKLWTALLGGGVATALFELLKYAFVQYVRRFPTYEFLYGALATIPIFLLWLYLSWVVVLIGALFTRLLNEDNSA